MSTTDLGFTENFTATTNPAGPQRTPGAVRPSEGMILLEVMDADKEVLFKDTIQAPEPAPTPWRVDGASATKVVPGDTGVPHQEITVPLDADLPFDVPDYVRDKQNVGGVALKVYWSCHE